MFKDLTGQKFGKLTVLKIGKKVQYRSYWICQCECGKIVEKRTDSLNENSSCGCYTKILQRNSHIGRKHPSKHGMCKTRIYRIYAKMKNRCLNPNNDAFYNYGGRGITVCEDWKNDFETFYNWAMTNGYADNLTIDRIDNNGNYEPSNCRWVDFKIQARNTRKNKLITYNGEIYCMSEWAEKLNMQRNLIGDRLKRGWSIKKALETPAQH